MAYPSTRETLIYELALEWVYRRPYHIIREHVVAGGLATDAELLEYGRILFQDACRLYRGELNWIRPLRWGALHRINSTVIRYRREVLGCP